MTCYVATKKENINLYYLFIMLYKKLGLNFKLFFDALLPSDDNDNDNDVLYINTRSLS